MTTSIQSKSIAFFLLISIFMDSCNSPKCDISMYKEIETYPNRNEVSGTYSFTEDKSFKLELKLVSNNMDRDSIYFRGKPFWFASNDSCNIKGTYIISYKEKSTLLFKKEYNILCYFNPVDDSMNNSNIIPLLLAKHNDKLCLLLPKSKSQPKGCLGPFSYYVENCNFYVFDKQ